MVCHETKLGKHIEFAKMSWEQNRVTMILLNIPLLRFGIRAEKSIYYQPPGALPVYMPANALKHETTYSSQI